MKSCRLFLASLLLTFVTNAVHADPLNALTGTYAGTLLHERSISLVGTTPLRTSKFRQVTRVSGFGAVDSGSIRTIIRLITPPRAFLDAGTDREIQIDFQADPPTVKIVDGLSGQLIGFPIVTVKGKSVVITASLGLNGSVFNTEDKWTLKITRTRP
jgi:hypothetical protein